MFRRGVLAAVCLAGVMYFAPGLRAADHRDAPGVDAAPEGDITDVFAFVDPTNSGFLVMAMGVNPFIVPAEQANYRFSTEYLYQFKIDRYNTYNEDFVVQVQFKDSGTGQVATVSVNGPDPDFIGAINQPFVNPNSQIQGPVGGVFGDPNSIEAFTGTRDDPFVFDFAQFDRIMLGEQTVFRNIASTPVGPLAGRPLNPNGTSGVDSFAGFNASYIVVRFPIAWLGVNNVIHVWGTVSAPDPALNGYQQFERMGQAAFSTIFIPKQLKDAFNQTIPSQDMANYSSFVPDALTTTDNDGTGNTFANRVTLLNALGLTSLPNGAPLLFPSTNSNTDVNYLRKTFLPDVLRLDLSQPPGNLEPGVIGVTNGRRFADAVIDAEMLIVRQFCDINFPASLKVPGSGTPRPGALTFGDFKIFIVLQGTDFIKPDSMLGDLTQNGNDQTFLPTFPFVANPNPLPGDPGTTPFPVAPINAPPSGSGSEAGVTAHR
jgi:hypothetical protein